VSDGGEDPWLDKYRGFGEGKEAPLALVRKKNTSDNGEGEVQW
jgi:hypothetical protein